MKILITGGAGYIVGDVLGITTSNVIKGRDAQITVQSISGKSTLYLKNVQGEEFTTGRPLVVDSGSNQVSLASTLITSSGTYDGKYEGNVIEVSHYNHGMTADNNFVTLENKLLKLDDIYKKFGSEISDAEGIASMFGDLGISSEASKKADDSGSVAEGSSSEYDMDDDFM